VLIALIEMLMDMGLKEEQNYRLKPHTDPNIRDDTSRFCRARLSSCFDCPPTMSKTTSIPPINRESGTVRSIEVGGPSVLFPAVYDNVLKGEMCATSARRLAER
jgi:hypothetical protein